MWGQGEGEGGGSHKVVEAGEGVKGCTHGATEALPWLLMSTYYCIESVCRSVGTLFSCDRVL